MLQNTITEKLRNNIITFLAPTGVHLFMDQKWTIRILATLVTSSLTLWYSITYQKYNETMKGPIICVDYVKSNAAVEMQQ